LHIHKYQSLRRYLIPKRLAFIGEYYSFLKKEYFYKYSVVDEMKIYMSNQMREKTLCVTMSNINRYY